MLVECPMFNLLIVSFFTTSYFRLSVINIFTRRNPHLKFLPKEGKTLIHIPFVVNADSRSYVIELLSSPFNGPQIPTNIWQIQLTYIFGILNRPKIQFWSISKSKNWTHMFKYITCSKNVTVRVTVQSPWVTKLSKKSMSMYMIWHASRVFTLGILRLYDGEDDAYWKMCLHFTLEFHSYLELSSVSVDIKTCPCWMWYECVQSRIDIQKIIRSGLLSKNNLEISHFALVICGARQRSVPRNLTLMPSYCVFFNVVIFVRSLFSY